MNFKRQIFFLTVCLLVLMTSISLGQDLTWVVNKEHFSLKTVDFQTIYLEQGEEAEDLYYSLSPVLNKLGEEFPRENIYLTTIYHSDLQQFEKSDTEILFLTKENKAGEIKVAVQYPEKLLAGDYYGTFSSKQGENIPFVIRVEPHLNISLSTREIKIDLNQGPGIYKFPEILEIEVDANYPNWHLEVSTQGLYLEGEEQKGLPLPIHFSPKTSFSGSKFGAKALFSLELSTELTWQHQAGTYLGYILLELENRD